MGIVIYVWSTKLHFGFRKLVEQTLIDMNRHGSDFALNLGEHFPKRLKSTSLFRILGVTTTHLLRDPL